MELLPKTICLKICEYIYYDVQPTRLAFTGVVALLRAVALVLMLWWSNTVAAVHTAFIYVHRHKHNYIIIGVDIPANGNIQSARDLKVCTGQIQSLVLEHLNSTIAMKLLESMDILKDNYTGGCAAHAMLVFCCSEIETETTNFVAKSKLTYWLVWWLHRLTDVLRFLSPQFRLCTSASVSL